MENREGFFFLFYFHSIADDQSNRELEMLHSLFPEMFHPQKY